MPNDTLPPIITDDPRYKAAGKLKGKTALITGGDSGIGAATAIAFAKEGAKVAIVYYEEDQDANDVRRLVEGYGSECLAIKGDLTSERVCRDVAEQVAEAYGTIDVLVNNAGTQTQQASIEDITAKQLDQTFRTNIYSMFFLTKAALARMPADSSIINTASVTAYRGSKELIDYSATKGAIVAFTRSLSQNLADRPIRVNAVAPGPIWTPLIFASFDAKKIASFGTDQPLGRAGQPIEVAPAYVFLASQDARYVTGQVLHVNGGEIING